MPFPRAVGLPLAAAAVAACLLLPITLRAAGQRVTFRTDDGVTIAATWFEPSSKPAAAVVLVHMLHRNRHDWEAAGQRLASEGIGALAIDLRGHGESTGGVGGDPPDYAPMVMDLKAARRYLATRSEVQRGRIGVAGASIGANLAVLDAAGDPTVVSLALLSPSMDYRGLRIEAAGKKLAARPMWLVASDDDPYAGRSAKDLQKGFTGTREVLIVGRAGHGTNMLARDSELAGRLVDWFRRTLL